MKLKHCVVISILVVISASSCNNSHKNQAIMDLIKHKSNSYNFKKLGGNLGSTGAFQIFKTKELGYHNPIEKTDINDVADEYLLYRLAKLDFVKLDIKERQEGNTLYKLIKVNLTDTGKKLLIHENENFYFLKTFDFVDFDFSIKKLQGDTIKLRYQCKKIYKTPIFGLIKNSEILEKRLIHDQHGGIFVKSGDTLKMISYFE